MIVIYEFDILTEKNDPTDGTQTHAAEPNGLQSIALPTQPLVAHAMQSFYIDRINKFDILTEKNDTEMGFEPTGRAQWIRSIALTTPPSSLSVAQIELPLWIVFKNSNLNGKMRHPDGSSTHAAESNGLAVHRLKHSPRRLLYPELLISIEFSNSYLNGKTEHPTDGI
ncbi:hypothetical protein AVEN_264635-1 [Araneus ventricosus]|uniref:Uncharacterized protein n=1 Tax=Araneus ventricosus TaxID=182803 RepID=A0A4Y2T2K4_ARAVE|nr:hypothetical protein AVEN_264635-1 [Araneus ventricosus]